MGCTTATPKSPATSCLPNGSDANVLPRQNVIRSLLTMRRCACERLDDDNLGAHRRASLVLQVAKGDADRQCLEASSAHSQRDRGA